MIDLRLGDYREVLQDVSCDLCLVDAPYSARTHKGHNNGADTADRKRQNDYMRRSGKGEGAASMKRSQINYTCWGAADVEEFVSFWQSRCHGWLVSLTDNVLAPVWAAALEKNGRYVFAPLPFVNQGAGCRYLGDGPSNWTCWIVVARPRSRKAAQWGTLPGAYILPEGYNDRAGGAAHGGTLIAGGKPLWLMRALVRDYSRVGDLVCDPCSGGSTTLIAAAQEGRRAVGAELDPATHAKALKRIARTPINERLDFGEPVRATQGRIDL